MNDVKQLVRLLEVLVDGLRLLFRPREYCSPHVLQQNRIELADRFCCAVIFLHQLFTGAPRWYWRETKSFGERRLVVKQQSILSTTDQQV